MSLSERLKRLQNIRGGTVRVYDYPSGRILHRPGVGGGSEDEWSEGTADHGRPDVPGIRYDVISLGAYSYYVEGAPWPSPGDPNGGTEIIEDDYGENYPVLAANLTRIQVEAGRWCWGRGDTKTRFSLAVVLHGNPRGWDRYLVTDDRWWHEDDVVPADEIFARSLGRSDAGGSVCLTLKFGVFEEGQG